MHCYFLRHGIAEEPAEWAGSDFDRPLTRAGRARMEREAKAIAELQLELELIVTSPLLRARQTAEIVAQRLDMSDALVEDERLAEGFDAEGLGAILRGHGEAKSILLVGHEPAMSATIGKIVGNASVEMKKGALAGVELSGPAASTGMLICLIPPKLLAAIGKK
jgi:phosphohistidine phosphatase